MCSVPTTEQLAAWEEWLATLGPTTRAIAERLPPFKNFRLISTGQRAEPMAYAEDGTVRALCWRDDGPPGFDDLTTREVFGLDPNDFREIPEVRVD